MKISQRLLRMQPSATRVIAEKADELKAQGVEIISFSTGEPDFVSPPAAFEYARRAMDEGKTFYTATAGIKELREEIAKYYKNRFGLSYGADQIIVGGGAKPLLFEALGALINPGDEVILTTPAWVSYHEHIQFLDGVPVVVESKEGSLDLDMDRIESSITDNTVAIVVNSPQNPTGKIYDRKSIEQLCHLAIKHNFVIINDEVYERIIFDGADYRNPLCFVPEAAEHVLSVNAMSKTYAMTGWRVGFCLGPRELIKKMISLQGHLTSGTCSIAQWAAVGALRESQPDVEKMSLQYQKRKDVIVAAISDMPLITFIKPQGAFYVFVDIRNCYGKRIGDKEINNDIDFCELLLEHAHIALIPGAAFLQPGYVRISFATSLEVINAGMTRLKQFLTEL